MLSGTRFCFYTVFMFNLNSTIYFLLFSWDYCIESFIFHSRCNFVVSSICLLTKVLIFVEFYKGINFIFLTQHLWPLDYEHVILFLD